MTIEALVSFLCRSASVQLQDCTTFQTTLDPQLSGLNIGPYRTAWFCANIRIRGKTTNEARTPAL